VKKIRPGKVERRTPPVFVPPTPGGRITFSYSYYTSTSKFGVSDCTAQWFESLLERLRALSSLSPQEVFSSRSPALRAHPIEFSRTSEPQGFVHLNHRLRSYEPYQFQLSKERGRVHGFFIDLIFYIVWLDPHHLLYP
jgi:hypothetical protein